MSEIIIPTFGGIKEAAEKTGLAQHYIRQLCIQNKIVHVRCGNRYRINMEKLIDYLNTNTGGQTADVESSAGKIRRLS